jgi:hypothetical protein
MQAIGTRSIIRLAALAVIAAAATPAASVAGEPVIDARGNVQQFDVAASPPVPGRGIIFDFQLTDLNLTGARPTPPTEVVLRFPRGVVWNGARFPKCRPARLRARGAAACPAGSRFASGRVLLDGRPLFADLLTARVRAFVGTPQHGHPTQVFLVEPSVGPRVVVIGELRSEPRGPYGAALHVDLRDLPALPSGEPVAIITSFHLVDRHLSRRGRPLIVAPRRCTGWWGYSAESRFATGPPLVSPTRQPCAAGRA